MIHRFQKETKGGIKKMEKVKKVTLSGMLFAIGLILPLFIGQIPAVGKMLLPMHIPVLICGLITVQVVMNDTIRTEEDVTKYLGLSVLASVPEREGEKPEDKEAMISGKSKPKTGTGKSRKKKGGRAS